MSNNIEQLRNAYELSPDNPVLQKMYFAALKENNHWVEAENVISKMLQSEPGNLEYHIELGTVLYKLEKISKGILFLESILEKGESSPELYKLLIQFYFKENNHNEAQKYYNHLISKYPGYNDADIKTLFEEYGMIEEEDDDRIKIGAETSEYRPIIPMEKPNISFVDVGGMKAVKEDIAMKIINPIKHSDLFKKYGKKIGGGILLYGPPGCGKTHIARATAGEIDATFISVGINDVLDMYLGQSEKRLNDIFEFARNNTPCVLFFDEVDALGASKHDMRNNAGRNIINQLLQEMDGIKDSNDGILILGATNAPWYIDDAFKRPGRFDQIIFIPPPDEQARKEILEIQMKDIPNLSIDIETIAKKTNRYTGADIKQLIDQTIETKLQSIIKSGKETDLTTKDFIKSLKRTKPSSLGWFETARNYAIYSNKGGQYDDILAYLEITKK